MDPYIVTVRTGSAVNAGTNASIRLSLTGTSGTSSGHRLDHKLQNNFKPGSEDTFQLDLEDLGDLICIELANDGSGSNSDWHLRHVDIRRGARSWHFPFNGWIPRRRAAVVLEAAAQLPQHADALHLKSRRTQIDRRRAYYNWARDDELPSRLMTSIEGCDMPLDEEFSTLKNRNFKREANYALKNLGLAFLLTAFKPFDAIEDMDQLFKIVPRPGVAKRWTEEAEFGRQMLAGIAPNHLRRVTELPATLPLTDATLGNLLGPDTTLRQALAAGRMFLIDYAILEGIPLYSDKDETRYCPPAQCLLYRNDAGKLLPVAIKLTQDPAGLVFTPNDAKLDWLAAKLYFKCALGNVHQMITHALRTHLCMEPFQVAMSRNLATSHPVFKLMRRHLQYTLAINAAARESLIGSGGVFDEFIASGGGGHLQLAMRDFQKWTLLHNSLPHDLAARGVDDTSALPDYPYRDDSLLLWAAIGDYVRDTLKIFYTSDEDVRADTELRDFAREVAEVGHPGRMPHGGELTTFENLAHTLQIVIFTVSVQHAAVNFGQYDFFGYVPNCPLTLRSPPPTQKGKISKQDFAAMMPSKKQCARQLAVVHTLSSFSDEEEYLLPPNGKYRDEYFYDERTTKVIAKFHERLRAISATIKERNAKRDLPYEYLLPERIPTSIAI